MTPYQASIEKAVYTRSIAFPDWTKDCFGPPPPPSRYLLFCRVALNYRAFRSLTCPMAITGQCHHHTAVQQGMLADLVTELRLREWLLCSIPDTQTYYYIPTLAQYTALHRRPTCSLTNCNTNASYAEKPPKYIVICFFLLMHLGGAI